jgi:3-dehydroquinate synthase
MTTEPAHLPLTQTKTQSLTQTVTVDTGRERYDILIGRGLLAQAPCWTGLPRAAQAVVVSNATIAPLWGQRLVQALQPHYRQVTMIELPDGEAHKDWPALNAIFDHLLTYGADRKTVLFALGGGVVGPSCRCPPPCWPRWIPRWAARRPSTTLWART